MDIHESPSFRTGPAAAAPREKLVLQPPVLGFRTWTVWRRDPEPRLHSLVDPHHCWLPGQVVTAGCALEPGAHAAPHLACHCGVYALKTWRALRPYLSGHGPESQTVAGMVALSGTALAGRWGWRAEFGRLLEIIPLPDDGGLALAVASVYRAPITPFTGERFRGP